MYVCSIWTLSPLFVGASAPERPTPRTGSVDQQEVVNARGPAPYSTSRQGARRSSETGVRGLGLSPCVPEMTWQTI